MRGSEAIWLERRDLILSTLEIEVGGSETFGLGKKLKTLKPPAGKS